MGLFDNIMSAVQGAQGRDGEEGGGMAGLLQAFEGGGASAGPSSAHVAGLLGGDAGPDGANGVDQGQAAPQGIGGMLETLAANGLGEHVSSWLTNAPNLPISPQQIYDALGSEQVQQLASSSGLPVGDFLRQLSDHLPNAASEVAGTDGG